MSLKKLLKAKRESGLLVTPRFEEYLARNSNMLVDDWIGELVKKEITTPQRNRRMTFSASARGACPREQVFQFTGLKPRARLNSELHAIFLHGTWTHMKWQAMLLDAKVLSAIEVPCVWDAYNLTGTIDGVGPVPAEQVPLWDWGESHLSSEPLFGWELKSINDWGFKTVCQNGPSMSHLLQVHAYMLATGLRVWCVMYENKNDQTWKEFVVPFDQEIADGVEWELRMLNEHVEQRELPPILDECKRKEGAFRKCQFAHVCLDTDSWPERTLKMRRI